MEDFADLSEALAAEASSLVAQSDRLVAIRNLLLPELVTGQIDVSALDLNALVEAGAA
jgi:type I restriction enzyme S subunit